MFKYRLYQVALFFFNRCSQKLCYRLAECIADLQYFFSWKDRRAVRSNLKKILPSEEDLAWHTREVFRNFGRYLVDFFQMDRCLDEAYIKKYVDIGGLENIDEVLAQGKGCIAVSAHLGNWELGAGIFGVLGYAPAVVALSHKEKLVNDLFVHQRAKKNISVIPVEKASRQCLEALKKNKVVAIVADRDFHLRGEVMSFLGCKSIIPRGAVNFSRKTGAAIVPIFLTRNGDGRFTLAIEKPIWPSSFLQHKDEKENILDMIKAYLVVIEEKIRRYPSQWLIFREFWTV
ncbi:hypothetical protein MNBD_UNCLBAC01-763 [hydrothermal vent metagenome]|uniref:Lipid A biosynthesis lauroyl acyltransferase n=1 Tax=hydrothermal vent metagenome TaxID=652676 RepID=A0A3B1DE61_9ZZZZ